MSISVFEMIIQNVKPPRTLITPHPRGATLGEPGNKKMQRDVILAALGLFEVAQVAGGITKIETGWGG